MIANMVYKVEKNDWLSEKSLIVTSIKKIFFIFRPKKMVLKKSYEIFVYLNRICLFYGTVLK